MDEQEVRDEGERLSLLAKELLGLVDFGEVKFCGISEGGSVMLVDHVSSTAQVGAHLTLNSIFEV
ncbi:hypothetical protein ACFPK9_14635 [Rubritalea spongiae]|uniref:Uncharacterized protein n=1 Tax=Rubritalea spongiae TaxID=430797 RepID=A0ABW5DY93_9BACT